MNGPIVDSEAESDLRRIGVLRSFRSPLMGGVRQELDFRAIRHGLTDMVVVGRKRIPASVPWDAERLECLVFSGYDPHFEGDEPPGL